MFIGGIALIVLGFFLCVRGGTALGNSASHADYGVSSEGRHKLFAWIFVGAGVASAALGLWLIY